jgi:hypothetical protein
VTSVAVVTLPAEFLRGTSYELGTASSPRCVSGSWSRSDQHAEPAPVRANANHLALTVDGLPDDVAPGRSWLVDVGLDHDPTGSFTGMDVTMAPASTSDFLTMRQQISTSPGSGFVRVSTAQRRSWTCVAIGGVQWSSSSWVTSRRKGTASPGGSASSSSA